MIAGLRATNEALLKQELLNASMLGGTQADVVSGTSNGSLEKKEPSPECHDPLSIDHTKEATPSTSELNQLKMKKQFNSIFQIFIPLFKKRHHLKHQPLHPPNKCVFERKLKI